MILVNNNKKETKFELLYLPSLWKTLRYCIKQE